MQKYHRAFGVYGLCIENEKLLVINKSRGPYINRFDLPGGSLEEGESLSEAIKREFLEETGLEINVSENLGVIDFQLPWKWQEYSAVHHIAVYYLVNKVSGELSKPTQFDCQDSQGALWVTEKDISVENSSPLVVKAFEWIRTRNLGIDVESYEEWHVKTNSD
ncbi:NUDIX hydrolase [Planococcus sp. X10-3]|uniref:NUDIX hydrolase n=1 Tax=Planococcus sp. X10-3 TaxID=3061240 RepID=UPI003BB06487